MENSSMRSLLIITLISLIGIAATAGQNSVRDLLHAHNRARIWVGVSPLSWNATLEDYAVRYAEKRHGDCAMEHSMGPYGENLAVGSGTLSAADAVRMWANEMPHYDYNSNSCLRGECRHYTQVVWSDSTEFGCARRQCRNGGVFVICSYNPPGNIPGQRPYQRQ